MLKCFETEGPFGLPMKDRQAKALMRGSEASTLRRLESCARGGGG